MKLNINIDAEAKEPEIMITTAQMTEEVNRVVDFVSRLDDAPTIISGIREDKVALLDPDHIVKIYAEDSKVFTQTDNGTPSLRPAHSSRTAQGTDAGLLYGPASHQARS